MIVYKPCSNSALILDDVYYVSMAGHDYLEWHIRGVKEPITTWSEDSKAELKRVIRLLRNSSKYEDSKNKTK